HDLAERILRMPGDAERRDLTLDPGPVVLRVVQQFLRIGRFGHLLAPSNVRGGPRTLLVWLSHLQERPRLDAGAAVLAAHVDLELGPDGGALRRQVGHPDPHLEARREGAAGDHAAADDPVSRARGPALGDHERHQLLSRSGLAHRADSLRADVAAARAAAPAETGLDRTALGPQIVAVEMEADLGAQRVAR